MVFNSFIFILLFLPATIAGYFLFNKLSPLAGKIFLAIANVLFYLYGGWKFMLVTCASILVNMLIAFLIKKCKNKKVFYIIGLVINILFLVLFKYTEPFLNLFNLKLTFFSIILPLGISYYTFQQIAFLSAIYKGEIEEFNVLDYIIYILFFPKIMMGPLIEYKPFIEQLNDSSNKSFQLNNFLKGIKMFTFGLFKKVVFAEIFAAVVNHGFSNISALQGFDVSFIMICYTFQIYFDFSGYTDMAVGVSLILNFDLPHNFNSPYRATSIKDFWKRWHITLTKFLTKYIYIPLGGNRKGKILTCVNILIVFLISGLWHGANFTFLLWGAIYGVLSIINRFVRLPKTNTWKVISWIVIFSITNLLFLLFRSESVTQWFTLLKILFTPQSFSISSSLIAEAKTPIDWLLYLIPWMNSTIIAITVLIIAAVLIFFISNNYERRDHLSIWEMVLAGLAITVCLFLLSRGTPFIYSGF